MAADKTFIKDPSARLDYTRDWAAWLAGDSIVESTWSVDSADLNIDAAAFTSTTTTVWLLGGTAGVSYLVTNHIVTASGREDDRTFKVSVKDR